MKKIILFALCAGFFAGCQDEYTDPDNPKTETSVFPFSEQDVVKGFIRIKLSEEPAGGIAVRSSGGEITTGLRALDASATALGITRMERTFPPAGKFEGRTRREGLHLWYDVWFSEEVPATRAVRDVSALNGIETAAPALKVVSHAVPTPAYPTFGAYTLTRDTGYPFNDTYLNLQWNFNNPGTQSWQLAGADIGIFEVWEQYHGHPDIVIALVDGGIALDNPDMQANLWINPGEIAGNGLDDDRNGYVDDIYGYNFVSSNATIKPQRHGTHVAGIIAATNNNGTGVSGIAGGNGTPNSGVKLMNCQIFEHPGNHQGEEIGTTKENTAAAIKYGADNGAVISQNSWGYAANARYSYLDPVQKAAIDYFVKYAGCDDEGNQLPGSPMKGGLVLFAAANSNTSDPGVSAPADYEKVLGVASVGPDFKKVHNSAFGNFIDICGPGGTSNTASGIYSTTTRESGFYEYRYGTSMACPHVAGVAALVIQKHGVGKRGFTVEQLEKILLSTASNLDAYNPEEYIGMLGAGCVNAPAALRAELPEQSPSFTLVSNPVTNGVLSFRVNLEHSGDAVVAIYNSTGSLVYRKSSHIVRYATNQVDIGKLSSGHYSIVYECNGYKIEREFIKY